MTNSGLSLGTDTGQKLLRRLDILIGLVAVVVALQAILLAYVISESFVPAFLVVSLFGLGVVAIVRSLLD